MSIRARAALVAGAPLPGGGAPSRWCVVALTGLLADAPRNRVRARASMRAMSQYMRCAFPEPA